MKLSSVILLIAAATLNAGGAAAQSWPTRPVTLVIPLGLGGGADTVGRILAPRLSEILGQPVVVENVTGAGGMVGGARVARAEPDGYQVLLGTVGTQAQNQSLYKVPLYDSAKDFEPVALMVDIPILLVVRPDSPAANLQEFAAYAKANQSKMQYGSPGIGSSNHLACLLLNSAIGADTVTNIPYRNAPELNQDLLTGRIDYYCPTSTAAISLLEGHQAKGLALLGPERLPIFPDLATAKEQGIPNLDVGTWFGLFLPKNTPATIVRALNAATIAALTTPAVEGTLRTLGATVVAPERRSPEYLARFVPSEIAKWAGPIKATGTTLN